MYLNFYKKWVNTDQSKTMHTHLFAKNRKLHKFAITYSNFEKKKYFRHASLCNVHVHQFSAKSG